MLSKTDYAGSTMTTSPLTIDQMRQLQHLLEQRRSELQARQALHREGRSRTEHARDVLLQDGDDATQRDADREVDLAIDDRDVVEISQIEQALQRLVSGRYGACAACGEPLPFKRLEIEPQALYCIRCATERERGDARPASM